MAQGKGVLSKILNFIGLVDDEDTQDTYDDFDSTANTRNRVNTGYRSTQGNNDRGANSQRRPGNTGSRPNPPRGQGSQQRRSTGNYGSSRSTGYQTQGSRFDDPQSQQDSPEPKRRSAPQRQTLVTVKIETLDDCCDVIDNLILNKTVALNMEDLDNSVMQRCIDTLSGAVFALDATIKKLGEGTYMLAPKYVEVSEIYSEHRG